MPSLLFEIGCEELPASACIQARGQLRERSAKILGKEPDRFFLGPRRLAIAILDLPERSPDQWVKGPPVHLADKAAAGFAAKHGVRVEALEERDGFLGVTAPGRDLADTLPDQLAELARGVVFSKSMRWNGGGLTFSRPIRWTCAKFDATTIEVNLEGVPSRGTTFGHRFAFGEIDVPSAEQYEAVLRSADVEPDDGKRSRIIASELRELGLQEPNPNVLAEVAFLVEKPTVLQGQFDKRFLELPRRVVETAMESHQRYFPLAENHFAFVANGGEPETVIAGNEHVLAGRLEDASFTFERDVAKGIEALAQESARSTFVAGAGTFGDKVARLEALVEALGGGEASREAARLAKADQAAELVREFPDLEGHIGAEYARLAGFPEAVCAAIDEQYLPESAGGPLPETESGRVLAAAEKIDNLTVAFSLGQRPTGSRDPYGIRRAAIGLCRLALEAGLEIDLGPLVQKSHEVLVQQGADLKDDPADVVDFVLERLEGLLDVPVEFVRAARAGGVTELGAVARLAEALAGAAAGEEFERAYVAYARSNRLAGKADGAAAELDPKLATDEAEIALIEALASASPRIASALEAQEFEAALSAAADLRGPVDRFFDEVLVMADDAQVRANRLRLLLDVRDAVGALGDLSQIPR